MPSSALATSVFWRDVLSRAVRNGVQVLAPVLLLASSGHIDGVTALNAGVAALLAACVVVLKALTPFNTGSVFERAVGAAAGSALAILPLDLTGVLHLDVRSAAISVLGSAILAMVMYFTNPPTITPADAPVAADAGDVG